MKKSFKIPPKNGTMDINIFILKKTLVRQTLRLKVKLYISHSFKI